MKTFRTNPKLMFSIFILVNSIFSCLYGGGDFTKTDSLVFPEFELARQNQQHILLVFSGSDWCRPCIQIENEILNNPHFLKFAKNRLVIIKADFPQRKKLPPEMVMRNEWLAERYNSEGAFPKILLLDPDQAVLENVAFLKMNAWEFVDGLNSKIKKYTHCEYKERALLMGCQFQFSLVDSKSSTNAEVLLNQGIQEIRRIEHLISEWIDTTQLSRLNQNAGKPAVAVDEELYELIRRSVRISELTQGAFDISFHTLSKLWKFDGIETTIPDTGLIREALTRVGYEKIRLLDSNRVFLEKEGMALGFGGIGKGYAADRVKDLWLEAGIEDGVINASGDLIAWGKPPGQEYWKIAIADPKDPNQVIGWLPIKNAAVATSGNYEKYLIIDGKRYSHIIDPRTGFPTSGIASATVIAPSAELADALATSIFVLGLETGMDFINQLPHVECIIVDHNFDIHFSNHLELMTGHGNQSQSY